MKNIKSKFIIFCFILLAGIQYSNAQSSTTDQIGLRLGGFSGIDFRHITASNFGVAINVMGNMPHNWTLFSVLAEKHFPLGQQFVLYAGAGGYFSYAFDYKEKTHLLTVNSQLGLEGIVGVDYYIINTPFNIGLDIRPRFYYLVFPYPWDAGIAFRYIF